MSNTSTDPIADMLTRIRNAVSVRQSQIKVPHSKVKESIAGILKASGFIDDFSVNDDKPSKTMLVTINKEYENSRINEIVRLSRPGRRQYSNSKEIPVVKRGRGIIIISTSKGMLTGQQAKKQSLGGELICKVY